MSSFRAVIALLALLVLACSKDSPTEGQEKLCPDAGVGARVTGKAAPVDVCVDDDRVVGGVEEGVITLFTVESRYDVTARMRAGDGTLYELQMLFPHITDYPKALNLTSNLAAALGDPDGVWLSYRETPENGSTLASVNITGGTFRLTFSDTKVAAGTLEGVTIDLENETTKDTAGTRSISEGFFSISVDS